MAITQRPFPARNAQPRRGGYQYLITDKSRLTALVMLGIKDRETFP
ncbi:hypothetical protein MJ561_03665 [Klebsiella pneumoniae]|nr:hypothetical protein MJ561_03665 [Klebsiella pneumoniae]